MNKWVADQPWKEQARLTKTEVTPPAHTKEKRSTKKHFFTAIIIVPTSCSDVSSDRALYQRGHHSRDASTPSCERPERTSFSIRCAAAFTLRGSTIPFCERHQVLSVASLRCAATFAIRDASIPSCERRQGISVPSLQSEAACTITIGHDKTLNHTRAVQAPLCK
jgi:hypothetical protein